MPVIKSARKKLKKDKKRTQRNDRLKKNLKSLIHKARKEPSLDSIKKATSIIDKAVKYHLIHKNKASRMKSALARFLKKSEQGRSESLSKKTSKVRSSKKTTAQ